MLQSRAIYWYYNRNRYYLVGKAGGVDIRLVSVEQPNELVLRKAVNLPVYNVNYG